MCTGNSHNRCVLPLFLAEKLSPNPGDLSSLTQLNQEEVDWYAARATPMELDTEMFVERIGPGSWNILMPNVGKKEFLKKFHERNERTRVFVADTEMETDRESEGLIPEQQRQREEQEQEEQLSRREEQERQREEEDEMLPRAYAQGEDCYQHGSVTIDAGEYVMALMAQYEDCEECEEGEEPRQEKRAQVIREHAFGITTVPIEIIGRPVERADQGSETYQQSEKVHAQPSPPNRDDA